MTAIAFLGVASLPSLDVRYYPETSGRSINVTFRWPEVSGRTVEAEATSKIEGVLSGIRNCSSISSSSSRGAGNVSLTFDRGADMQAVRFEVASRIRNLYPSLPEGVSYPAISLGVRGTSSRTDMTFVFRSPLPSYEIGKYVSEHVVYPISSVEGVERADISGDISYEMEIRFDAAMAETAGITAGDIASACSAYFRTDVVGLAEDDGAMTAIKVRGGSTDAGRLQDIPVVNSSGRIVRLGDIAGFRYIESEPDSYFRLNGLNTITLNVGTSPESNLIRVASEVRKRMERLSRAFPEEISVSLSYDSSAYMSGELEKIAVRTLLCILILLAFVAVTYRSFRYLALIFATLFVNIMVAAVIYRVTGLGIHIYTLAGITVSLGIIIDSSIVMADHYSYYRNRSVFPALLGATATTVGALCVIYLLPESERRNLEDFSKVIIINITVALVTAYAFIPSLVDRFPPGRKRTSGTIGRARRTIKFNRLYARYIEAAAKRKWIPVLILVAAFGLPLCLLPQEVAEKVPEDRQNIFQKAYNGIIGWRPYADNRAVIDKVLGGSFAMFNRALDRGNFYREPGRNILYIQAGMPEGCTVAQLNEVVKSMENFLGKFNEIESFTTNVSSYDNATIEVTFLPEYENTSFPAALKSQVTAMAINFGGANWRVWGINESYFNNNVTMSYKNCRIILRGYNFDDLYGYAVELMECLSGNRRVSAPEIMDGMYGLAGNEFNIEYDFGAAVSRGVNPYHYFTALESHLYDTRVGYVKYYGNTIPAVLRSSDKDSFDLWHITNTGIAVDSTRVKMSEIGKIVKKRSGITINRKNQSYEIVVGFDFIGSYELSRKVIEAAVKRMNDEVLPVGYRAEEYGFGTFSGERKQYAGLLMIVIAIIFVMCSMIFESLRMPFAVILMIPISFVGVFLTFGFSDFIFDQGGFAALVMLSGIVVNAGIYLVNEYKDVRKRRQEKGRKTEGYEVRDYIRAYNHKIHPIMLTVISTVLGLVPFLFDGPDEVFWFPFAVGTIGGLVFSLIALIFYMPLFCLRRKPANKSR